MLRKIMVLTVVVLIFSLLLASTAGAWKKGLFDEPVNTYAAGTIHFYGGAFKVSVEDYGQGHIIVVLDPEGAPEKEKRELYLSDWQSFMDEVKRVNSYVKELGQLGEKVKEVLTLKEFLKLKEGIGEQTIKVEGITKDVHITKGLLFHYTLFMLVNKEGDYVEVSWEGKHKVPEKEKVVVEGNYDDIDEEIEADKVVW